jgi:LacI family transcriptional regulator
MTSATINDVALKAGVSIKTVSRVLNAEPHVRDELRQKVLNAVQELHYRPNVSARSLAGGRHYVVGFLLSGMNTYQVLAQLGALRACRERSYHLLVESLDLQSDIGAELEQMSQAVGVDGVLLLPPLCDNAQVLDSLDRLGVPYVRVSPASDQARSPSVDLDDEAAARVMTEHLLGLGHRRIAFVCGKEGHGASARRLVGYRKAMQHAGADLDPALIHDGDFTYESGRAAASALLALDEPPTAVFAANDLMACGVLARAHELGLQLPASLSVAGVDDIPEAAMVWPALTTMRQPIADMAAAATEMIIARAGRAKDELPEPGMFRCELVVRGSTAPLERSPAPRRG